MKKILLTILIILAYNINLFATHNLGGSITYKNTSGLTYEVKLITYTDIGQFGQVDRQNLALNWGDGTTDTIDRISQEILDNNIALNTYTGLHTYNSKGFYKIFTNDPSRSENIINFSGYSGNVSFYIESELNITQNNNFNNSIQYIAPHFFFSEINKPFSQNISVFDPDGDNLTFEIVNTKGINGTESPNYYIPDSISINKYTGEVTWNNQTSVGEYVITIKISECRNNEQIGSVLLDIPIIILSGTQLNLVYRETETWPIDTNNNFSITVSPNDSINLVVITESTSGPIELIAQGEPIISPNSGVFQSDSASTTYIRKVFKWTPNTFNIRCSPYIVTFRSSSLTTETNRDISVLINVRDTLVQNCQQECNFTLSIKSKEIDNNFTISPNPFKYQTSILFTNTLEIENAFLYVYSILGKEVASIPILNKNNVIFYRNNLPSGIYLYTIQNKLKNYSSGKFIITD